MKAHRLLVTGATGFVGRYVIDYALRSNSPLPGVHVVAWHHFSHEHEVGGERLSHTTLELLGCDDAALERALKDAAPTVILHLAAQSHVPTSWSDPSGTWRANVDATRRLLAAAGRMDPAPRFIQVSSAEVYGTVTPDLLPLNESLKPVPRNPYAASKLAAEVACAVFGRGTVNKNGAPVVILRPFAHIGPGQRPDFFAPAFAEQLARINVGLAPPVIKVGSLSARRDLCDVRDMVRAYLMVAAAPEEALPLGQPMNIGTGESYAISEILERLIVLSGAEVTIEEDPARLRPSDTPDNRCDATFFRNVTGWAPQIPLNDTLRDLLEHHTALARREKALTNPGASAGS